ncbi:MAG: UDP-N-acetylmuramoyl-L-alanine--D-glutamate ligase [Bacillota bacterium]
MFEVRNKDITVIGLSKRTGVAVTKILCKKGANVTLSDIKSKEELKKELDLLKDYNFKLDLGGHSEKSLQSELIVVSPGVPLDLSFFQKAKKKKIPVISEIELAYRFTKANIIGITGTNGKTTTTSLTGKILKNAEIENKVKIGGNIGIPLIEVATDLSASDWVVAEISSFQLEAVKEFRPYIGAYLNFTPDHLDRHKNIENYFNAKKNIFKNQTQRDYAVINLDDKQVKKSVIDCKAKIFGVSLNKIPKQGAFIENNKIMIKIGDIVEEIIAISDIPLRGKHNIMNTAFASLISRLVGVKPEIIKREIKKYELKKHRLQKLDIKSQYTVIDDSKATNPDAAIQALKSCKPPIILIAGGQDRNADFTEFAKMINQRVKTLILMGETKNKLKETVLKTGFKDIYVVDNMENAVKIAVNNLESEEVLLLSPGCPSWDMYSSYKKRGKEFQEEVKKRLK